MAEHPSVVHSKFVKSSWRQGHTMRPGDACDQPVSAVSFSAPDPED
jgi:hypothetical protein